MNLFSEMNLSSAVKTNLAKLGLVTPTPVQVQAIPAALSGRDVVATAQTGTGKTAAFLLPVIENLIANPAKRGEIAAVILSPTRELALQINEAFGQLAFHTQLRSAVAVGGMSEGAQLQSIRRGAQVLIATPGRLTDFLERRLVRLETTRIVVLDEADRMLDMGFLPAIRNIMATMPAKRQTLFFSATIETSVAHLIEKHVKDPVRITIGSITKPSDTIDLHVYEVDQDRKYGLLDHLLRTETGTFLVFARTRHGADRLAKRLTRDGEEAAAIHGDRTQAQRNRALKGFQSGEYRVLVATDVAARGIHVEGIAHVVNYDLPQVPEDFIHRVGRTGRAGERGVASTFAMRNERGDIMKIERVLKTKLVRQELPTGIVGDEKRAEMRDREEVMRATPAAKPKVVVLPVAKAEAGRRRFSRRVRAR
jgi:ATP-dependent RNA helicase RhlE